MVAPLIPVAAGAAVVAGRWAWNHIGDILQGASAGTVFRKNVPQVDDRVTVEVYGQPGASKQELYYLALAAACGTVRRLRPFTLFTIPLLAPTFGVIQIEYDAASNWVRCSIQYKYPTLMNETEAGESLSVNDFYSNMSVYRGPQCETVGGKMDFVSGSIPGVPNGRAPNTPVLPWSGRVIVTNCPRVRDPEPVPAITQAPPPTEVPIPTPPIDSPNPKPPGDNRSRGVIPSPAPTEGSGGLGGGGGSGGSGYPGGGGSCCPKQMKLIELVFTALSAPGVAAELMWAGPTAGPRGG